MIPLDVRVVDPISDPTVLIVFGAIVAIIAVAVYFILRKIRKKAKAKNAAS